MKKSAPTPPARAATAFASAVTSASALAGALTPAKTPTSTPAPVDALRLRREDLLGMEPLLASLLRRVLPFATHSLYFSTAANTSDGPQWLPRERTLLLPLIRQGEVLGVFTARGADGRVARRLLPELPALVDLCLDNLELERRGRCDALTGLSLGRELLGRMAREADMVRQRFSSGDDDMGPLHRVCMALVVVRCRDWHALAAETSYAFAESLLVALSAALTRDLPLEALAARTGDDEFAVLLTAGSGGACRRFTSALLPRLDAVSLPHPVTRRAVRLCCSVGHALYPQDMDVALLPLPMEEQARTLLHKARLAATAAQERFDALLEQDAALDMLHVEEGREARSMAFGRVVHEGGVIRRALPLGRAETSLGRHMGACEGLRFAVWSRPTQLNTGESASAGRCKGEIILVEVREKASIADIVHWTDPADGPDKGDVLTLLPQGGSGTQGATLARTLAEELPTHPVPHLWIKDDAGTAKQQSRELSHELSRELTPELSDTQSQQQTQDLEPSAALLGALSRPQPETPSRKPSSNTTIASSRASAMATTLLADDSSAQAAQSRRLAQTPQGTHNPPALLRHGDFARQLARHCEGRAAFTLVLVRLCETSPTSAASNSHPNSHRDSHDNEESRMLLLHLLCRRRWEQDGPQHLPPLLSARYGQSSLIFLHSALPHADAETTRTSYESLCNDAAAEGLDVAVGIAGWPHLRFTRADMPECCRKALDLALLLPRPRVGVFGSLALHISADKQYSRGDIFGAVEEYKLALLADRNNSMAWNSLGVCMAALSRQQEARGHFLKALQGWKRALRMPNVPPPFLPADTTLSTEFAATLYNLGTVCQALGERRAAARHFRQCVDMQPQHYFAHLRLGQLAEEGRRVRKAHEHYTHALQLEDSGQHTHGGSGMARRQLARLAVRGRKLNQARELLHEALRRHPHDAAAMGMLAELYLDGGDDPTLAEMLARHCVSLRGGHAPSWRLLAKSLRALDRHAEADAAEAHAEGM